MTLPAQPLLLVAPFIMLRTAGLPAHYVSQLPDDLSAIIRQHHLQEPAWRQLGQALIARLHANIALPSADSVRQDMIRCRRHIFNDRYFNLSAEVRAWLAHYDSAALEQLTEWLAIANERRQLAATFNQRWQRVNEQTQALLLKAANEPALRRALCLASPQLLCDLEQNWQSWPAKRRRRVERSLFAYMIRAAGKVSPFSTFSSFSLVPFESSAGEATLQTGEGKVTSTVHLNRSIALALRDALYTQLWLAKHDLPLCRNPSLQRISASQMRGHFYRYEKRHGLLWNEEQQFVLGLEAAEIDAVLSASHQQSWSEWRAHFELAGMAPPEAERLLRKLVRKDVLRPTLQWGTHHPAPLADVLALMPAELSSDALRNLPELPERFGAAENSERVALLEQAQQTIQQSWERLTRHQMPEIRNILYEDAWREGIRMTLPDAFIPNVLARVAKAVAKRATLSQEYLWLLQNFIDKYGAGGHCTDVSLFLQQSWQGFIQFTQQRISQSAATTARWRQHNINPATLKLPVTLFLQLDTRHVGQLAHPRGKVVINNAYSRIGWQLARTTLTNDSQADDRRHQLQNWLRQFAAPALPLTFSVSGESSNLQAQARLAAHHLCLDEPPQVAGDLTLDRLQLHHDTQSGLLKLTDNQGQAFQLCYLGAATPMVAWGTKYLLTVLAEPVQIGRPAYKRLMANELDHDFRHAPRMEEEDCVLIRETWWVRSSRIFHELSGHQAAEHPARLLALLLKNGIPTDSYVNGQFNDHLSWQSFNNDKIRKPMWCRLGNSHCLDQLLLLARKVDWLVFREALPSPENSWMEVKNETYLTEIHTEMVIPGDYLDASLMSPLKEKSHA